MSKEKIVLMKYLIELYNSMESMKDCEMKIVIQEYVDKKEKQLVEILNEGK